MHTGLNAQVGGEVAAQADRVAIRVAVQVRRRLPHRPCHVIDQCRRWGMRILVRVQPHRHVELRCTIR